MKKNGKQMQTERGLIYVVKEYNNSFDAREDGYSYMFTSRQLGCDVYGKSLDREGHRHECVLITGRIIFEKEPVIAKEVK